MPGHSRNCILAASQLRLAVQRAECSRGQLQATPKTATLDDDVTTVPYLGAPLTATQGYLPDVHSWAVGSEIAFGRHNTLVLDVLGNEIGLVHGIPNLVAATSPIPGFLPVSPYSSVPVSGLTQAGTTSYSQFNGATEGSPSREISQRFEPPTWSGMASMYPWSFQGR